MNFKTWLFEVGASGGVGGGIEPVRQDPEQYATAMKDYHGSSASDPSNPDGVLPPVTKKPAGKVYRSNGRLRKRSV